MRKLKGELIDIIEWIEEDDQTLACRFERYGNEIKNGAKLVVREGQTAVFVNEGKLADVFEPGLHELSTRNLPLLSTLLGWKHGFQSPFKAEVYFLSRRLVSGFGWGTPGPFRLRDREFGILELTARGSFGVRVEDPARFLKMVIGTEGEITKEEIKDRLRQRFVTEAVSAIAESGKSFYELAGHYDELSAELKKRVGASFREQYGLEVADAAVQSIDLTEMSAQKVESRDQAMFADSRMDNYERQARADAARVLAGNPGAGAVAASGLGLGVGMAMAGQLGQALGAGGASPPPPPQAGFHLYQNGQQSGPFPPAVLAQMAASGALTPQTQVWRQGLAGWQPAATVPELAGLFQTTPPPPAG